MLGPVVFNRYIRDLEKAMSSKVDNFHLAKVLQAVKTYILSTK